MPPQPGASACNAVYQEAIDIAVANGSTVVVAAGNSNANAANSRPASCNNVIAVGATRITGGKASYSNWGDVIDLSAPGGGGSADPGNGGWDGFILDNWLSSNGKAGVGAYAESAAITITGMVLGNTLKNSLMTGLHLFQIGEFSFILALEGKKYGLITDDLYQAFLSASIITMIMTPFLIRGSSSIAEWIARKSPLRFLGKGKGAAERYPGSIKDHVIIIGFGLNGGNLARVLRSMDIKYVTLELNSKTVRAGKKKGEPIYYGDGTSAEVLHKIGIRHASVLVVAISDAPSTRRIVQLARSSNPHLYIIARTKYVAEVEGLKHLGANDVVPEEFETSVEIFSKVLNRLQVPVNDIRDHIDRIRQDNYLALRVVKLPRRYLVEREDILKNIVIETYRIRQGSVADEKTLRDLNLRSKTGVTVIGIERAGEVHRMPSPSLRLVADDVLLFIGSREDIDCAVDYLDSSENGPPQCSIREDV